MTEINRDSIIPISHNIDGIPQLLQEINSRQSLDLLKENNLDPYGKQLRLWRNFAGRIIPILDKNNVEYTLMKAFDIPYARMVDIDLLIENKSDMIKTISILKKENYEVKKLLFFYPFKLTAIKSNEPIIIDLYYKPKWYDFTYAPEGLISSQRIRKVIHGIRAFLPSPELNVYIVATHGYSHGRFTLEEIFHLMSIILKENLNLLSLMPTIDNFRTAHTLYCYIWIALRLLDRYFGYEDSELQQFLIELQKNPLTRYYKRWIEHVNLFNYHNYPIYIPFTMLFFSGLTKLPARLDPSVKRYDETLVGFRHFFVSNFLFHKFGQILQKNF